VPVDTIDIYVNSSFYSPSDYEDDVDIDAQLAEPDVIGAANLPVVVNLSAAYIAYTDVNISMFTVSGTISGSINNPIASFMASTATTTSGKSDVTSEYNTGTVSSFYDDVDVAAFIASTATSGQQFVTVDFVGGQQQDFYVSTPIHYWLWPSYATVEDFEVDFSHIAATTYTRNFNEEVRFNTLTSGTVNENFDITFAGYVFYDLPFVVSSTVSGIKYLNFDMDTTTSGNILYCMSELYCSVSGIGYVDGDLFCCVSGTKGVDGYVDTTTSGTIKHIDYDIYCTLRRVPYLPFDIDLYSLKISNFYPGVGNYIGSEGIIYADVTDDVYNVVTSGTYFTVSGTQVSGTFDPITDGYRMYYDSPNDYASLLDSTEIVAHAENDNGDVLERSFYITHGYYVLYEG
jgi:hypothetical protein